MKVFWDGFYGLAAAISTTFLVLGAFALVMTEGMMLPVPDETATAEPTTPFETVFAGFPTPSPRPSATKSPVSLPSATIKSTCQVAAGWEKHTILNGETLNSLAGERGVTGDDIRKNNCLDYDTLVALSTLYLPPLPPTATLPLPSPTPTLTETPSATPSATARTCGNFRGWVRYTVQHGDTLYRLGLIYSVSVDELRYANCLSIGDNIIDGKQIWVPNVAPRFTATSTPVPPRPTAVPPSAVPSTATFTRTFTLTATLTFTPLPATRTFTATYTATVPSPVPATITFTPKPAGTNPATNTAAPTATPAGTSMFASILSGFASTSSGK